MCINKKWTGGHHPVTLTGLGIQTIAQARCPQRSHALDHRAHVRTAASAPATQTPGDPADARFEVIWVYMLTGHQAEVISLPPEMMFGIITSIVQASSDHWDLLSVLYFPFSEAIKFCYTLDNVPNPQRI